MKNVWKMTAGAVLGGLALAYCISEEAAESKNENRSNLEERVQTPVPSSRSRSKPRVYPNPLTPENEKLEETRQRIIEYAEEVKRNQEMFSSGNPGRFLYGLPDFSDEEDDVEKTWYNLPLEERTPEKIAKGFNGALDAKDYRVAASYINNFEAFALPGEEEEDKKAITYVIVSGYNDFLNEIIQDCQKNGNNYDSIFRKVIWMDFFLINNQKILPMADPVTKKELELIDLIQKGEQAIQVVSNCQTHE